MVSESVRERGDDAAEEHRHEFASARDERIEGPGRRDPRAVTVKRERTSAR